MGVKFHSVTSGDTLGVNGLYNASTFGLIKSGYTVTGWLNVDNTGKSYSQYDFTTKYSVNDFITQNGTTLKNASDGAYIYLQPVWKYTNAKPVITYDDIYVLASSDITAARLLKDVIVEDKEDGDLTDDILVKNLDDIKEEILKIGESQYMEDMVEKMEMHIQVSDSHGETVEALVPLYVVIQGSETQKNGYIRYISSDYQEYFKETSVWKQEEYRKLLERIQ